MDGVSDRFVEPKTIGVSYSGGHPPDFPRPAEWRPSATLILAVEQRKVIDTKQETRWSLARCHGSEDAATADVFRGDIHHANERMKIVVKMTRVDASMNVSRDAVEERFRREQRVLTDLCTSRTRGDAAPVPLKPNGDHWVSPYPMEVSDHLVYCLAANHALKISPPEPDLSLAGLEKQSDVTNACIETALSSDLEACHGCRYQFRGGSTTRTGDSNSACRKWLVSIREPNLIEDCVQPAKTPLLLLDDQGKTLREDMDDYRRRPRDMAQLSLRRKTFALTDLARRLRAIHHSGFAHLDLNPDNLCLNSSNFERPELRPIDFGHSEKLTTDLRATVEQARIPLRAADFAAPEMQMRKFPLQLRAQQLADEKLQYTFETRSVLGWSPGWWPHQGDCICLLYTSPSPRDRG